MEEVLNGNSKDEEVYQKLDVEEDGIKALHVEEESFEIAVIKNGVGNGEEKGVASSSSSSSDEEAEVVIEKTDETVLTDSGIYDEVNAVTNLIIQQEAVESKLSPATGENGVTSTGMSDGEESEVSDLIVAEDAVEMESNPVTEELTVVEMIGEDISEAVEEIMEEERDVIISGEYQTDEAEVIVSGESQTVEAVAVELADMVSDKVESAEELAEYAGKEGTDGAQQRIKEEDIFPAIAKSSNGTDENSHKEDLPVPNGNPILSISARTVQPTSWRGCCGLLEVFKRGDR